MTHDKFPFVSVILPVRNEERHIQKCLEVVFNQNYPKEKMEVLVIDGMSQDRTREIAQKLGARVISNPKGIRFTALNIGVKNARGEIIVRVDARTLISKDYVQKCVQTLLETGADNVGGPQRPIPEGGVVQRAIGLAATHPFGAGGAEFRLGRKSGFVDSVYLGCFKKEIFDKVGLFDEQSAVIAEDADINWRIKKAGGKVYLNKDIEAYYIPRNTLKDLWRLYFRYGGARAGFFLKHKALKPRQAMPLAFSGTILFLSAISVLRPIFLWPLGALLAVYLSVDFGVSLSLSLRQKRISLLPLFMLIFPCMHFSWAMGFIRRMAQRPRPGTYWGY